MQVAGIPHRGIDGQTETIPVETGSVVIIPRDTPYWDVPKEGEGLFMISINNPPYNQNSVETLEKV